MTRIQHFRTCSDMSDRRPISDDIGALSIPIIVLLFMSDYRFCAKSAKPPVDGLHFTWT